MQVKVSMKRPVISTAIILLGTGLLSACAGSLPPLFTSKQPVPLAIAEPLLNRAEKAYIRHEYADAVEIWQGLANKGNATAQFRMGVLFTNGEITRKRKCCWAAATPGGMVREIVVQRECGATSTPPNIGSAGLPVPTTRLSSA